VPSISDFSSAPGSQELHFVGKIWVNKEITKHTKKHKIKIRLKVIESSLIIFFSLLIT
jgi:hypothetical protein